MRGRRSYSHAHRMRPPRAEAWHAAQSGAALFLKAPPELLSASNDSESSVVSNQLSVVPLLLRRTFGAAAGACGCFINGCGQKAGLLASARPAALVQPPLLREADSLAGCWGPFSFVLWGLHFGGLSFSTAYCPKTRSRPMAGARAPRMERGAGLHRARNAHCVLSSHETVGEFPPRAG